MALKAIIFSSVKSADDSLMMCFLCFPCKSFPKETIHGTSENIKNCLLNIIPSMLSINQIIRKFLKWTNPFLNLDMSTASNRGFSLKSKTESQKVYIRMRQLVMSRLIWIYKFSVFRGICLWSAGRKGLKCVTSAKAQISDFRFG